MKQVVGIVAGWMLSVAVHAATTVEKATTWAQMPEINLERTAELRVRPLGVRLLSGVSVPVFQVDSRTGLDLSDADRVPAPLSDSAAVTAKVAEAITLVHLSGYGWLAIPRDWHVVDAGVGADGSMVLIAQAKRDPQLWLQYQDTGNCFGCGLSAASCYFPKAFKQATDDEMFPCEKPHFPEKSAFAKKNGDDAAIQFESSRQETRQHLHWRQYRSEDANFRQLELMTGSATHFSTFDAIFRSWSLD